MSYTGIPDENAAEFAARKKAFLEGVIELARKHEVYLSHEDGHGSFLVGCARELEEYGSPINFEEWLRAARDA